MRGDQLLLGVGMAWMRVMEQAQRRTSTLPIAILGRMYVRIGFGALSAITLVIGGRMIPGPHASPDPYSVVSDFFDGDARRVALARGFTCENDNFPDPPTDTCRLFSPNQEHSSIDVSISDMNVTEIDLSLPRNTLALGDLVLLWGKAKIRSYCETTIVSWSVHHITAMIAIPRTNVMNYFVPVHMVTFTRRGVPHWKLPLLNDSFNDC